MKSLDAVVKAYEPVRRRHMPVMFASVLLWGKVVEAERGYRAQYGRVAQLMPTPLQDGMAEALSARYGVPISDRVRRSWLVDGPMHDSPLPRIIVLVDAERIEFPGCPYLAPSAPGRWRVQLPPGSGETPGKPRSGGRWVTALRSKLGSADGQRQRQTTSAFAGAVRIQRPPGRSGSAARAGDVIEQLIQGAFATDIEFLRWPKRLLYRLDPDDGVWRFERVTGDCTHEPGTN
jgi:hypothetical protein